MEDIVDESCGKFSQGPLIRPSGTFSQGEKASASLAPWERARVRGLPIQNIRQQYHGNRDYETRL